MVGGCSSGKLLDYQSKVYSFERGCIHVWQVHNGVKNFLISCHKMKRQKNKREAEQTK